MNLSIKVRLKDPKNKVSSVFIDINTSYRYKYYIGKIETKYFKNGKFDTSNQEAEQLSFTVDEIIMQIKRLENATKIEFNRLPTKDELIEFLAPKSEEDTFILPVDFFKIYDEFLEEHATKPTKTGIIRHSTIKKYNTVKNNLLEFQEKTGFKLSISNLDMNFYGKFQKFRIKDKGVMPSTFGEIDVKLLKSFLEWAYWRDYPVNKIYKKFTKPRSQPDLRALKEEEILALWNIDAGTNQYKLDLFLFMLSTLMSVSDQMRIKEDWITNVSTYEKGARVDRKVIVYQRFKTDTWCYCPFEDDLYFRPVYLYNKYEGKFPKISDVKLNEWLREDLPKLIKLSVSVSTKVARKTGATQRRRLGMSLENLMKIGGWKSEKSIRHYLGMSVEDMLKEHTERSIYFKVG